MKKLTSIFAVLFLMTLSVNVFAQNTATTNASAKIVNPIAISQTGALAFGKIAAGSTAGTVALTTGGVISKTGGVTLIASTIGVATYTVTGEAGATYLITLPSSTTVKNSSNDEMTIDTYNHNITGNPTLTGGTQTFSVGATLNVDASQPAGDYTGTYDVTVAYN